MASSNRPEGSAGMLGLSSRYAAENENPVLVVLASPFDSIIRRAF
jgi:hypothetical protein